MLINKMATKLLAFRKWCPQLLLSKRWIQSTTVCGARQRRLNRTSKNAALPYLQGDAVFDDLAMRTLISGIYPEGISDIVIKRKENIVNISFYVYKHVYPSLLYFLKGFSESLLSRWHGLVVNVDVRYAPGCEPPKTKKDAYRLGQTWDGLSRTIHVHK